MWVSLARSASCLGLGALLGVACTGPGPATTDTMESESIGCPIGSEGCACTPGGTCDEPLVCASKVCVSTDSTTGPGTTGDATTGTETSNGTIAGECSPANDRPNAQCEDAAPYCNTKGLCADCNGIASCAAIDAGKPACDPLGGGCVECTATDASACGALTPICDAGAMSCRACVAHAECSKSACDFDTGACFPEDQALWVDAGTGCDDAAEGTEVAPLCTISKALQRVGAGPVSTPRAVLVRAGNYSDPLVVPDGHIVAIVRTGSGKVQLLGEGAQSVLVGTGSTLLLGSVEVRGNTMGDGVGCKSGVLRLDDVLVEGNKVSGVAGTGCTIRVNASVVTGNADQGLMVSGKTVTLENAFVTGNGTMEGSLLQGGLVLAGKAKAEVVYSTFVGNTAYIGGGSSVECTEGTVQVHSSIVFNAPGSPNFNCGDLEVIDHSALSQEVDDPTDDNIGVPPEDALGLLTADVKAPGVYRPKLGTVLDGVAKLVEGDPPLDFEGDPRPVEPGFPGADQP